MGPVQEATPSPRREIQKPCLPGRCGRATTMSLMYSEPRVHQSSPASGSGGPAKPPRPAHEHVQVVKGWLDFEILVDRQIAAGRRYGLHPAVLLLELGLPAPDLAAGGGVVSHHLLQAVGARLRSRVRSTDVAVQVGERHFGVVLVGAPHAHVPAVQQRLNRALAGPYNMGNALVQVSLRMAAAAYPDVSVDGRELVQAALASLT